VLNSGHLLQGFEMFSISVIISTLNSPDWLEKVLCGFGNQDYKDFQIVVADDGSTGATRELIEKIKQSSGMNIEHVWHEDKGCQKSMILNKAIMRATGDYLIFTEGDCIPRRDFVTTHKDKARIGKFLSGGHTKLPMCCSKNISNEAINSGKAFDLFWLVEHGYPDMAKKLRLIVKGPWGSFFDFIFPTQNKWNGHNSSGWKSDLLSVNGFDERMQYVGEDCEMGDRLKNAGVKVRRVRYTAVCIHLFPILGNAEPSTSNLSIKQETKRDKKRYTKFGIVNSDRLRWV
jgi:glycosyltransferase involved in cell wall biosynthesis